MIEGSVSTNKALGTYFSELDKENIDVEFVVSWWTVPSGLIPCSRQNKSQHTDPTWTPACPMCMQINSPCLCGTDKSGGDSFVSGAGLGSFLLFLLFLPLLFFAAVPFLFVF